MKAKQFQIAFPPHGVGDSFLQSVNKNLRPDRSALARNIEMNLRGKIIEAAEFDDKQLICKIGNQQLRLFADDASDSIDFELTDSIKYRTSCGSLFGNLDRIEIVLQGSPLAYVWEPNKIINKLVGSKISLFDINSLSVYLDIGNAVALIARSMLVEAYEGRFVYFEFDVDL